MATIKIRSNPYERKIEYLSYKEQVGEWEEIQSSNPDSKLREDESGKSFLPFKIKEIVDIILDEYYVGSDKVNIVFEGTQEEYEEIESTHRLYHPTAYVKMGQIRKDFKQACEDFYNNVIINSPDFSPAVRERVLERKAWDEAERAKKEAESQKKLEEYRKQRAKEKAYEATHPKPKCPTCGSTNIEKISTLNRAVSIGMVGLASDKIGKQFCCKNCGYKW